MTRGARAPAGVGRVFVSGSSDDYKQFSYVYNSRRFGPQGGA